MFTLDKDNQPLQTEDIPSVNNLSELEIDFTPHVEIKTVVASFTLNGFNKALSKHLQVLTKD